MNHHDSVMLNGDSKETAREPLLPRRGHRSFNDSALLSTVRRDKVETAKRRELTRAFSMSPSSGPPPKLEMHARSRWGVLRPGSANPPVGLGKEPSLTEYTPCLGIDLGTTNSCVAAWNGKTATVLRSFQYSSTLIPSVVAYTKKDVLVGHAAVKQWAQNPKDTIFSSKRWMARPYDSAAIEASKKYPFDVVDDGLGQSAFKVSCREKPISPEQLGGYILEHIKSFAVTDHLRCDVRDAVITVPAYFNDAQRAATKKAGELAGLRVLMVLNEPTAAALACGLHEVKTEENLWQKKNILVFDLGGGTFDVTVMFMDKKRFEVLSTGGDTHLGGDDFDQAILEYFKTDMAKKWSDLPVDDDGMLQLTPFEHVKLLHRSREVKEALAGVPTQTFEIEIQNRIYTGQLSRARMDSLCGKLVSKVIGIMDSVLRNSGLHKGSIDDVVLVGGSTKMKKIQDMIESFFKGFKAFLVKTHSPDEIVAEGAVVKAAVMLETECKIPPPSLPLISDVVPQTVGVALPEDTYNVVIPRNSPIPSSQKLEKFFVYHTTKDFQTSMAIHVYQGEDTKATGNFFLGTCILGTPFHFSHFCLSTQKPWTQRPIGPPVAVFDNGFRAMVERLLDKNDHFRKKTGQFYGPRHTVPCIPVAGLQAHIPRLPHLTNAMNPLPRRWTH
ncbi:78 kDa glucose-regulated protein [Diplonema papillatum]|nr:78 kDa glucose-regulated protein [Diplonema papillatum]